MKRNIPLAPLVLVLLFAVSAGALAQQSNVAKAVYDKWRQQAPADEVSKLRFALAAVTRRTGDEVAEVDLWFVGRRSESVIEVQPLYIEQLPNGQYRQEQAGAVTKTGLTSSDSGSDAQDIGLKVIAPVRPNSNALEIKWFNYANGRVQNGHAIQVWLRRDEPSEALTRITAN
jgi:hypothetical protein